MNEQPEIKKSVIFEERIHSTTPIALQEIDGLWKNQQIEPGMTSVQFQNKRHQQLYEKNNGEGVYLPVVRSKVAVQANFSENPDHIATLSNPIQPQSIHHVTNTVLLPSHLDSFDALLTGMNNELLHYRTNKLNMPIQSKLLHQS